MKDQKKDQKKEWRAGLGLQQDFNKYVLSEWVEGPKKCLSLHFAPRGRGVVKGILSF